MLTGWGSGYVQLDCSNSTRMDGLCAISEIRIHCTLRIVGVMGVVCGAGKPSKEKLPPNV